MSKGLASALLSATLFAAVAQAQDPDPATQKRAWTKCRACHSMEVGASKNEGPTLHGVLGAKAGEQTGFQYSAALKGSGLTWNDETLDKFLTKPSTVVPGNTMPFPGMPNPEERIAVIAYLKANGGVH